MYVVRVGDSMSGNVGHHNNHLCPSCCSGHSVTGSQSVGSSKVFIGDKAIARVDDAGESSCPCCGSGYTNTQGSTKLFIGGKPVVRNGDQVNLHNEGTGTMTSSSTRLNVG